MICSSAPSCYDIIVAIEVDINPLRNGAWCNTMNKWCEWKIKCYCWKVSFCWKMKQTTTTTKKKMVKIECNQMMTTYIPVAHSQMCSGLFICNRTTPTKRVFMWMWCDDDTRWCYAIDYQVAVVHTRITMKTATAALSPKQNGINSINQKWSVSALFFLHCFWRY